MNKQIVITTDTSDDAMVGSMGWGDADAASSTNAFLQNVANAVGRDYPDYEVRVVGSEGNSKIEVTDYDENSIVNLGNVEADVMEILSEVYTSQSWVK